MMRILLGLWFSLLLVPVGAQFSVTTVPPLNGGNGSQGVTFNVEALSGSVTITNFDCSFYGTAQQTVTVWYKPGPINGSPNISTSNGWIQLGSTSLTAVNSSTSPSTPQPVTIPIGVMVPPGQTYGFYIGGSNVTYTSHSASNPSTFSNGAIAIHTGPNVGYGGSLPNPTNHPRQFNGTVYYTLSGGSFDDLSLLGFESPAKLGCDYADSTAVTVAIRNNGTNPRTNFEVSYRIYSIIVSTEMVTDTIHPGDTLFYTFKKKVDISVPSLYAFGGWVDTDTFDQFKSNDTILLHPVYVGDIIEDFPHIESFDQTMTSIPNGWFNDPDDNGGDDWIFDASASGIDGDHTTGTGYMAILDNSFPNGIETNLLTPCIDLSPLVNPNLEFYLFNAATGSIDLYVDVLSQGEWVNIAGPLGFQSSSEWGYQLFELTQFAGEVVKIRFRGTELGTSTTPDLAIDDVKIFNRPPINLGIVRANAPKSDCGLSDLEDVNIDIIHTGYDTLYPGDMLSLSFQVNGGFVSTENVTLADTLRPFETFNYLFSSPADLSAVGKYTIKIWTSHPLDDDPTTDTLEVTLNNVPVVSQYPYIEDFENGEGGWETGGELSSWAFGTPDGLLIRSASSGQNAWGTGHLQGSYNNDEQSYIISPCFDFSGILRPQVSFDIWYESQTGFDGASFQYSLDNGQTWNQIGMEGDDINWYNDASISAQPGGHPGGWTGYQGSGSNRWINVKHFMFNLAGQPKVRFRVAFGANASFNSGDGVAVDNFVIGETPVITLPPTASGCGSVVLDVGPDASKIAWSTGDSSRTLVVTSGSQNLNATYSVIIENNVGLYNVDTINVDLAPGPYLDFGPDTIVCGEDSLVLDTKASPTAAVLWNNGSTAPQRTVTQPGTYFAIISEYGCTKRDTIQVGFDDFPVAKFGFEQESNGQVVIFADSSDFANTYTWDFGDGFFSSLAEPQHYYQQGDTYTVQLIVGNDCGNDTTTRQVVVIPVGMDDPNEPGSIRLYPNPSGGMVYLKFPETISQKAFVELYTALGEVVRTDHVDGSRYTGNAITMDYTGLPRGFYTMRIRTTDGVRLAALSLVLQ